MSWRAVAMLVLLAASCANSALTDSAKRDSHGRIVESGAVGTVRLRVGDCYSGASEGSVRTVEGKPCATPHDGQVFARTESTRSGEWPGQDLLATDALDQCLAFGRRQISAVMLRIDATDLSLSALVPDKSAWDDGDRGIVCLIETSGAALSESLILGEQS